MKITAALAWFSEPIDEIEACIKAIPNSGADKLIAVDGGYAQYPGAKASSSKTQAAAIKRFAQDAGLECEVHVPTKVWRGQVEKRSHLLKLAAEGSDWIVGIDTDHIHHFPGVREAVRHEIAELKVEDAIDVDFWTTPNYDRPLEDCAAGEWHRDLCGVRAVITTYFRALPGIRVERFHWWISALKNDKRYWLWGGDNTYPRVVVHSMYAPLVVEHRCLLRQDKHILANRQFCEDRARIVEATGQEDPE